MNIDHLKYFSDSVELGSLVKSAKMNNVSPGAISQAIKKLEDTFGQALLIHKKNFFEPTEKGLELYHHLEAFLLNYQKIQLEISSEEKMSGELNFMTQQSLGEHVISKGLTHYMKKFPLIKTNLTLGNTSLTKKKLDARELDFAILLDNVELKNCNTLELGGGDFVLYRKTNSASQYLMTGDTPECLHFQKEFIKKHKKTPEINLNVKSWGILKQLANQGHGIALLPDYIIKPSEKKYVNKDLSLSKYKIIAAWPKSKALNKKSKVFLNLVENTLANSKNSKLA